jgi:acetyl esterase/lipase
MTAITRRTCVLSGVALIGGALADGFGLAAGIDTAPAKAQRRSSSDLLSFVDPQFRGPLEPFLKEPLEINGKTIHSLRAMRFPGTKDPSITPKWERRLIGGAPGGPDVPVYVINAEAAGASKPAILHLHGGGYVLGSAESAVAGLQSIASELNCVIVTVDYRLAPETKFPGSLQDNYAALKWLHDNATDLGVDAGRIALMGESAGGGHAAMLAIAARDRREIQLVAQVLIYPMLDDRTASRRDVPEYIGQYIWTRASNRFGWSSLLGKPAGSDPVPYGSVPARVRDLSGLPPAFIGVGSIDLFVDEDVEYARRLLAAGVSTELVVVPGAYHAFDYLAPDAPLSRRFATQWLDMLRRHLRPST